MTASEIVEELKVLGSESIKKTLVRHGAKEPFYGVKIEDLKKIQKRIKKNYPLALELYATGIADAQYLAGMITDDALMTKQDLERWLRGASWRMIAEYTIPGVAAQSRFGHELALKWIGSKQESTATTGWMTYSLLVGITPNEKLDLEEVEQLLTRIEESIERAPNRVRYAMNAFVISVGGYVSSLSKLAIQTAKRIGKVEVDVGDTSCKVPNAVEYIEKMKARGSLGKKRKSAKC